MLRMPAIFADSPCPLPFLFLDTGLSERERLRERDGRKSTGHPYKVVARRLGGMGRLRARLAGAENHVRCDGDGVLREQIA